MVLRNFQLEGTHDKQNPQMPAKGLHNEAPVDDLAFGGLGRGLQGLRFRVLRV